MSSAEASSFLQDLDVGTLGSTFFGVEANLKDEAELDLLLRGFSSRAQEFIPRHALIATAYAHELRHFHDYLLSPTMTQILFRRLYSSGLSFKLLGALLATGNAVPLPMTSWYSMGQDARAGFLIEYNSLMAAAGRPQAVVAGPLPVAGPLRELVREFAGSLGSRTPLELVAALLPVMAQHKSEVDYLWGGLDLPDGSLAPVHIFELSAILTQFERSRQLYGEEGEDLLRTVFFSSDSRYRRALLLAGYRSDAEGEVAAGDLPAASLATYSLIHDTATSGYGEALRRFLLVSGRYRPGALSDDVTSLYQAWDRVVSRDGTDLPGSVVALEGGLSSVDSFIDGIVEALGALELSDSLMLPLSRFADQYKRARKEVVSFFAADPARYADPALYLKSVGQLPQPILKIVGPLGMQRAAQGGVTADDLGRVNYAAGYVSNSELSGNRIFEPDTLRIVDWLLRLGDLFSGESSEDLGQGNSALEQMLPPWAVVLNVRQELRSSRVSSFEEGNLYYQR